MMTQKLPDSALMEHGAALDELMSMATMSAYKRGYIEGLVYSMRQAQVGAAESLGRAGYTLKDLRAVGLSLEDRTLLRAAFRYRDSQRAQVAVQTAAGASRATTGEQDGSN